MNLAICILIVAVEALSVICTIGVIVKDRKPVTPSVAIFALILTALVIFGVVHLYLVGR